MDCGDWGVKIILNYYAQRVVRLTPSMSNMI
jgi:hypothetical protein